MNSPNQQTIKVRAIQAAATSVTAKHFKIRWLSWPIGVFGIIAPLSIIIKVAPEHMLGALLAYGNCLIAGYACIKFFKDYWLPGAVPALFLPNTVLAWSLSPLYMAMFFPEHTYNLLKPWVGNMGMYRFAFYQFVFMVFLLIYLAVVSVFVRQTRQTFRGSRFATNTKALAYLCSTIVIGVLAYNAAARLANLPPAATYWADGLFKYYKMLMIVVGAFWLRLDRVTRSTLIIILIGFAFFYTLGNAREFAAFPLLSLMIGILFFSDVKPNRKGLIIAVLMIALPLYVTIGNITRAMGLDAGFENLGKRLQVVTQRSGEYMAQVNPFDVTMFRFFVTGGHNVVTHTPDPVPYIDFNPAKYGLELLTSLLPGRRVQMGDYGHHFHLVRYGHRVTKDTAVGITLLGHFWMLGGLLMVVVGAVATGLLHGLLVFLIKHTWKHSIGMALSFLTVLAYALIWVRGFDFIRHWRDIVWRLIFAMVIYALYRLVAGSLRRATRPQDTYPTLPSNVSPGRIKRRSGRSIPSVPISVPRGSGFSGAKQP